MKRNAYTPDEKAKMVLETPRGERTVNEIASAHNIRPNMLSRWKREAESNLYALFQDGAAKKRKEEKAHEEELQALYAKIGFWHSWHSRSGCVSSVSIKLNII